MKLRDGSKRRGKHKEYKLLTNLTLKLIKDAKARYYKEYVETNKHNPNKLAKLFDELSGKCKDNSVTSLTCKDKTLVKDKDIADAFNSHFTNITKQFMPDDKHESTPDLNRIQEFVAARVPPNNLFKIRLLIELDVERFLRKLDIRKATGLDNIDAKFLKLAVPFILKTLKEIRNLSISTKTFPTSWKVAKVSSLCKNNSKDDLNNYRPISALPILSKLLERHAAINHLFEFLTSHDLLATRQSGFDESTHVKLSCT